MVSDRFVAVPITFDDPLRKGQWRRWHGRVLLSCPECGLVCDLEQHEVQPGGNVEPSVICPGNRCGFHQMVKLQGWGEERKAAKL